jgi:hypothetical protein
MPDIIITPSSGIIDFFPVSTRVGRIEASGNTINIVNPSGFVAVSGSGLSINTSSPNATFHAYSATSGATLLNIEGTNGSLFSVIDNLSGTLMSVNNNAGLPVFEVFSDDRVVAGRFGQNDFIMTSGGNIGIGTGVPSSKLHVVGSVLFSSGLSVSGLITSNSGNFINSLTVNSTGVSISGHTHTSSDISNFNSSVSGVVSGIYAPLSSPALIGTPTAPTAASGTNTTQIASTSFVRTEISNLVSSAPTTLDTLNELAAALGNDASFSTTVTTNLAGKANLSGATFTGSISGPSGNFTSLKVNSVDVSAVGHTHTSSNITDFNSSVSGLLPSNLVYTTGTQSVDGVKTFNNRPVFNSGITLSDGIPDVRITLTHNSMSSTDGASITMNDNLYFLASNTTFSYYGSAGENVSFYDADATSNVLTVNDRVSIKSPNGSVSGIYFPVWVYNPSSNAQAISSRTAAQLLGDIGGYASSNPNGYTTNVGTVTGTGTTSYLPKWTSSSGVGNSLIFDNGTNIGINTVNPSGKFHIESSVANNSYVLLSNPGNTVKTHIGVGNSDSVPFLASTNNIQLASGTFGWGFFDRGTEGNLNIQRRGGGSSWSSVMTIDRTNGNVGIGTGVQATTPPEKLTVDGNIRVADTAVTQGNIVQFTRGGGGQYDYSIGKYGSLSLAISLASDSTSQRSLQVGYHSGVTFLPRFHVNGYTGAVGINTTTPSGFLDVAGQVFIRSSGNNISRINLKSGTFADNLLSLRTDTNGNIVLDGGGAALTLSSQGGSLDIQGYSTFLQVGHTYNAGTIAQHVRFTPGGSELMRMTTSGTMGIGLPLTSSLFNQQPYANTRVHIAGSGADSGSAALIVTNSGISPLFYVRNDGNVGIGTASPSSTLQVSGLITANSGTFGNVMVSGNMISVTNTNGNLIIKPNASGALQADNAGNSRGILSVDLQRSRVSVSGVAHGDYSVIGGGRNNRSAGTDSTIGGGRSNSAGGTYSTVGGGYTNSAGNVCSTVGGGNTNSASGGGSTVGGGSNNTASGGNSTIGGGQSNTGSGYTCTVGGGISNNATGPQSTVGGGQSNTSSGYYSTVAGGYNNTASATYYATVGGGINNTSSGSSHSTIGGGNGNTASSYGSTIGGGGGNNASGNNSSIGGGFSNSTTSLYCTIPGGRQAKATRHGEISHSAGQFANKGDAQHTILIARNSTVNASGTVLFLDGSSARLTIPAETTWIFTTKLSAYNDTDNLRAGYNIRGCIGRNAANGTSIIGSNIVESWVEGAMSGCVATATADDTNEALQINVTGLASKNIRWVAVVDISQVSYAAP